MRQASFELLLAPRARSLAACAFAAPALASEPLSDSNVTLQSLAVNSEGRGARHVSALGRPGPPRPRLGCDQRGRLRSTRPRGKSASSTTTPAAGASTTTRPTGRRSRTPAPRTTARARRTSSRAARRPTEPTGRMQSWQRGLPLLGFDPWLPRAYGLRAPPLALEQRARQARGVHPLDVRRPMAGRSSAGFTLPRPARSSASARRPRATRSDRYGRNVYIDTFNSAYGPGWKRESGILVHKPNGTFCHSFVPQKPFPGYPSQAMRPAGTR